MVSIKLSSVSKSFGGVHVLNNINLDIRDKEFFVILGPSGSGKTTILRLIAGLEQPSSGRILFDDEDVTSMGPRERNVSMIFQNLALFPHLSVFENIAFPLSIRKTPPSEVRRVVKEVAEALRIDDKLNARIDTLSGGEKQRVALARALVFEPRIFLMDEPLTGLEPTFRAEIRAEIKRIQRRLGVTTIYVTHDQLEAFSLADRLALLNGGAIQDLGTPSKIYRMPRNTWVASFIGSPPMNLVPALIRRVGDAAIIYPENLGAELRVERVPEGIREYEGKVILGIRPESLFIDEGRGVRLADGRVSYVEDYGDYVVIEVEIGETTLKVKSPTKQIPKPDSKVQLSTNVDELLYYDAATGEILS